MESTWWPPARGRGKGIRMRRVNRLGLSSLVTWITLAAACGGGGGGGGHEAAPVANAGSDQSVATKAVVTLDGSTSSDPNGDTITYAWSLIRRPNGSQAALSDPAAPRPTFVADAEGTYQATLVVNDGRMASATDEVIVTASANGAAPNADAGFDQQVPVGAVVDLDASGSRDPEGDALTYTWNLVAKPAASQAAIANPAAVVAQFTADAAGEYRAQLVVTNPSSESGTAMVVVTAGTSNTPPRANAGADQTVAAGAVVHLDGSTSFDADGDAITYAWSFVSKPPGSNAQMLAPTSPLTDFATDVAGTYVAQLVVDDGKAESKPDSMVVRATTFDTPPVADAGNDRVVDIGSTVFLNGAGSTDAEGSFLSYQWSFVSIPAGSAAEILHPTRWVSTSCSWW